MLRFVLRRLGFAVVVLTVVLTAVFFLLVGIGDPCAAKLGGNARAEQIASCRAQYGFDRPLLEQYTSYLGLTSCIRKTSPAWSPEADERGHCGLLQGDFGESMGHNEPVINVVSTRIPRTLLLAVIALGFELLFGLTLGVIAAVRRNTWFDTGFMALAFVGISAPTFLTGLLFLNAFAFRFGWFPVGGYGFTPWEHVYSALLPAFTLAIIGAATYARIMRSEMIETMRSDFVRTARAKGLDPLRVVLKHGVRNALLPIVTMMGLSMAVLVSGAVITETIYSWPGMGRLAFESIFNLDIFAAMAVVLFACLIVQLGNLLADIAVAALDPRVRVENR